MLHNSHWIFLMTNVIWGTASLHSTIVSIASRCRGLANVVVAPTNSREIRILHTRNSIVSKRVCL